MRFADYADLAAWNRMTRQEPALDRLRAEARATPNPTDEDWERSFRPSLARLVGFEARNSALCDHHDYEVATRIIRHALFRG